MHEKKSLLLVEVELLLSEKQTSLATLRTGIAVFTLPFSVLTILIATSSFYDVGSGQVLWMFVTLICLCAGLAFFGVYLVFHSMRTIKACDKKITEIKKQSKFIESLMVE